MKFSAENAGHLLGLNAGQLLLDDSGPRAWPRYSTLSDFSTAGSAVSSGFVAPSVLVPAESLLNDACSRAALAAAAGASPAAAAAAAVFASKVCCAWACAAEAAAAAAMSAGSLVSTAFA